MKPGILHYPLAKWERVPRSSKSRKGVGEGRGREGRGRKGRRGSVRDNKKNMSSVTSMQYKIIKKCHMQSFTTNYARDGNEINYASLQL